MSGGAPSPFWTFSLRFYAAPRVPAACLALQDGSGVDVNVLLFALYAARRGRRLRAADVARLIDALSVWKDEVVVPLRLVRRALKEPPPVIDATAGEALRNRVKAVELEAERLEQEALFAAFPLDDLGVPAPDPAAAARANVAAHAEALGATFDAGAVETLLTAFNASEDQPT